MAHRLELVQQLEARATQARTLSEAQALNAEADRLRGNLRLPAAAAPGQPLIRN
jgi:hypothetical protein